MIRRLLAFLAFAHTPAAAQRRPTAAQQPPAPCTTATPDCTEFVAVGGGPGRSLVYRNFPLDVRNDAIARRGSGPPARPRTGYGRGMTTGSTTAARRARLAPPYRTMTARAASQSSAR